MEIWGKAISFFLRAYNQEIEYVWYKIDLDNKDINDIFLIFKSTNLPIDNYQTVIRITFNYNFEFISMPLPHK